MPTAQKFLFDRTFDLPRPPPGSELDVENDNEALAETVSEGEAPVNYTESDLDDARQAGFSAGREEGRREGLEGQEKLIADALSTIADRLKDLICIEDEHHAATERQALAVMTTAARKVLPDLSERFALGEIEHLTRDLLERLRHDSRVTVRVHPDLADALTSRFDDLASELAARSELSVLGDAHVALGDCRLEWGDGGAERRVEALLGEMDAIISRNLDGLESGSTALDAQNEAAAATPPGETTDPQVSELRQAQETITRLAETGTSQTDEPRSGRSGRKAAADPDDGVETVPVSPPPGDPA